MPRKRLRGRPLTTGTLSFYYDRTTTFSVCLGSHCVVERKRRWSGDRWPIPSFMEVSGKDSFWFTLGDPLLALKRNLLGEWQEADVGKTTKEDELFRDSPPKNPGSLNLASEN